MSAVTHDRRRPGGWGGDGCRPGRLGPFFTAIWLLFLLSPLAAAWVRPRPVSGWVPASWLTVAVRGGRTSTIWSRAASRPRPAGDPRPPLAGRSRLRRRCWPCSGVVMVAWPSARPGTAARGLPVPSLLRDDAPARGWPLPLVAARRGRSSSPSVRSSTGWTRRRAAAFAILAASVAVWGIQHDDARATSSWSRRTRRTPRLAVDERAQPLRPRPARHPRPLADRDHGQGRAGQPAARRRPGARPGRARRPRAAQPRRAGRRTPGRRGLPRAHPARRARRGPGRRWRRPRSRPSCRTPPTRCPTELRELFAWTSARASPT